jgi:hypothetical protein
LLCPCQVFTLSLVVDDTATLLAELRRHGKRRKRALDTADQAMQTIAPIARKLYAAGVRKSEIAALGAISRPWLDEILKR